MMGDIFVYLRTGKHDVEIYVLAVFWFYGCIVQLRARGRATRGVRAMRLRENDKLAAMDIVPASLT